MKKSLILVGMLVIGYANAQEGTVGINTSNPKATLDIQPNATNLAGTTNEGILAPRLSKERIANIATPVEGTLVYATDNTYTGANTKVSKINEKGYYFYNGTEWVRVALPAGTANNQVLKWNGTAWAPATDTNDNTNIYTANGTLSANRTVDMAGRNLFFTNGGRIGIGTTAPTSVFTIEGDGGGSDDVHINTYNNISASAGSIYLARYRGTADAKAVVQVGDNLGNMIFRGYNGTALVNGVSANAIVSEVNGTDVKVNYNIIPTKNVGIGTNDPGQKLEVAGGNIRAIGGLMSLGNTNVGGWLELENTLKTGETEGARWRIYNMTGKTSVGIPQYTPGLHFWAYSTSATQPNLGSKMLLTDEGNLGIGLGSRGVPTAMLDVSGTTRIRGLAGTGDRPVAVAADGTLKVGADLQNLQGSTSVAITSNQIQRAALTGDVTAAANSNALTIANNAVNSAKIADNSVATADLANGAVTAVKLNAMGATNGQVLKWNGTAWAPAVDANDNMNIYTANGTLTGDRKVTMGDKILSFEGNNGAKYLEVKNASWYPLVVNSTNSQGGGIAVHPNSLDNRIEFSVNKEGDMRFYQHGNGDVMFAQKSTNRVGIGTIVPKAKLHVSGGDVLAGGSGQVDAYFGGDGVGGDVEVGSIKAGVTDVTLYNRGDSKAMNLVSGNVDARGTIKSTTLSGDGDKIVIANNDGTLVKGVSVNNFATSNIYTADGSTNGDRTVSTANGFLTIKGNSWNPLVVNSEIVPGDPDNNARGGLAVHPNDMEKRVEFATTKDGDSRIWLDGDKVFIKRATGNVGIGTTAPTEKLDVAGSIKSTALAGTGTRVVMADNTGKLVIGTNIRTETTATTLAESDNGGYVYINSSSAVNVTVPSTLPIGFSCVVVQKGTGQVTIVGSGATHETARGTKTRTKHSAIGIIKDTASTFTITGDAIN